MKKTIFILGMLALVACVSKTKEVPLPPGPTTAENTVSKAQESSLNTSYARPVDIAPLLSNYLAARLSEAEGQMADAAYFYDRAEMADPENTSLKERAFTLQLALGNMEESLRLAQDMVVRADPLPMTYILLGAQAIVQQDLDTAIRYFAQAKAISPELLQFHVLDAYINQAQGKPSKSIIKTIEALPKIEGLVAVHHYHLGRLYEKASQFDNAEREYKFAFETDSSSSFTIHALERLYEKTNQQEKLKILFKRFTEKNPNNIMLLKNKQRVEEGLNYKGQEPTLEQDIANVIFEIANLMSSQHLSLAATQLTNVAIMLAPENNFFAFYKGLLQEQAGAYEDAINTYNNLDEDTSVWLGAQIRMSDILVKQNKIDKALVLIESLEKQYQNTFLSRILAELYYNNKEYEKAISVYDRLLLEQQTKNQKGDFWMYFSRGTAYERLAQYEQAEADLKRSIHIQPNNPTALNYLGYMWLEQDTHINEAFALIGKALLIKPNDAAILDSMGWAFFKKGLYEKAVLYLERAVEFMPEDSTINMHLGNVYEKLNRYEEAKLHWMRSLQLGPEKPEDISYLKAKINEASAKLK